ncbi:hypothetical protein F4809DRAFT_608308 [Biscogniauxia mediterranea]|nr:hypothetical protein F4809DRAFT_608308 [Biscogniauxia mediterranea]
MAWHVYRVLMSPSCFFPPFLLTFPGRLGVSNAWWARKTERNVPLVFVNWMDGIRRSLSHEDGASLVLHVSFY